MAKYKIKSLNKITSGDERSFINMDIALDVDIDIVGRILELWRRHVNRKVLRIDIDDIVEFLSKEFNIDPVEISKIKERVNEEGLNHALSKIDDSHAIILTEKHEEYVEVTEDNIEVYMKVVLDLLPDDIRRKILSLLEMKDGFNANYECEQNQLNQDVNVLSGPMESISPIYDVDDIHFKSRSSTRNEHILNFDLNRPQKTEDVYLPEEAKVRSFCQFDMNTIILTDKTTQSVEMLSSSRNDDKNGSTYTFQLNNNTLKTYLFGNREDHTVPTGSIDGVKYNYIAQVPMCNIVSEYRNGNVYCDIYNAKNALNAQYSMDMPDKDTLVNCRDYVDVTTCGGKVFLKYYDNVDYGPSGSNGSKIPFQKMESFNPVDLNGGSNHKTPFFSVNIQDISLDDERTQENADVLERIKSDIEQAVREIARNVTPANTQLFDVYFGESI